MEKDFKDIKTEVESKLYEVLGIMRMIGQIQAEGDRAELLHNLESAVWSSRAAETIISTILGMIED